MKTKFLYFAFCMLLLMLITACSSTKDDRKAVTTDDAVSSNTAAREEAEDTKETTAAYKDGTYEAETKPDKEQYYTKATLVIKEGKITEADWCIYDAARDNKPFDENYYTVFEEELYQQQSKDDFSGSREYAAVLIDTQDIDKVDAVSGATWTNKKFKEAVTLALEEAGK